MIPEAIETWSDEEVAARWLRVFPIADDDQDAVMVRRQQLLADTARLGATDPGWPIFVISLWSIICSYTLYGAFRDYALKSKKKDTHST